MYKKGYKTIKHCRWCGITYKAVKPYKQDGFCSDAHKMAHHRAYKKYVTGKSSNAGGDSRVRKHDK